MYCVTHWAILQLPHQDFVFVPFLFFVCLSTFVFLPNLFYFFGGVVCNNRGQIRRDKKINELGVYNVKTTKNQQKVKKNVHGT